MRLWLAAQWRLTPFSTVQEHVLREASHFERDLEACRQLGLVKALEEINPSFEGVNAADIYESLNATIDTISSQPFGKAQALTKLLTAGILTNLNADRCLNVWQPVLAQSVQIDSAEGCRFDDRYVIEDTDFKAVRSARICAQVRLLHILRHAAADDLQDMRSHITGLARMANHISKMPLRLGALVATGTMVQWFKGATTLLRRPALRSLVRESLSELPPPPQIRDRLADEVLYVLSAKEWPVDQFESFARFKLPRRMIDDIRRLEGYRTFGASVSLRNARSLYCSLPIDEAEDGPGASKAYLARIESDMALRGAAFVPFKWSYLALPDGMRGRPWAIHSLGGANAAMFLAMRRLVEFALAMYDHHAKTGRFPLDPAIPRNPLTRTPFEYRNHGDRFLIFGTSVEFDSDPTRLAG